MVTEESGEYAICPYCKCEHGDCWEWVKQRPHESVCDECGKTFMVYAEYEVTYITYKREDEKSNEG